MKKIKAKVAARGAKVAISQHAKVEEVGIQQRAGDNDGGDKPCMYCLRNPARNEVEWFDITTNRYCCDMCAHARFGK